MAIRRRRYVAVLPSTPSVPAAAIVGKISRMQRAGARPHGLASMRTSQQKRRSPYSHLSGFTPECRFRSERPRTDRTVRIVIPPVLSLVTAQFGYERETVSHRQMSPFLSVDAEPRLLLLSTEA